MSSQNIYLDLRNAALALLLAFSQVSQPVGGAEPHRPACFELIAVVPVDPRGVAGAVDGLAFSSNGRWLAASDNSATARLYDVAALPEVGQSRLSFQHRSVESAAGHQSAGEMNAVAFSPLGRWLVTGVDGGGAKVWDCVTGKLVAHLDDGTNCDGAAFSSDGRWLASAADNVLVIRPFDETSGRLGDPVLTDVHGAGGEVNSIDWTADSQRVVSGALKVVKVHRLTGDRFVLDWQAANDGRSGSVKSVRFSPDGALVALGARDERARVLDAADGRVVVDLPHNGNRRPLPGDDGDKIIAIEAVEWSPAGDYLFTSGLVDGVIRAWSREDWSLAGWAQGQEANRAIETIAVQDPWVAVGGDEGVVRIFRWTSPLRGEPIKPQHGKTFVRFAAGGESLNGPPGYRRWTALAAPGASISKTFIVQPADRTSYLSEFQTYDPKVDSPKVGYRLELGSWTPRHVWVRGRGVEGAASLWFDYRDDGSAAVTVPFDARGEWQWVGAPLLAPGESCTLYCWLREGPVEVDQIVLSSESAWDDSWLDARADGR